MDVSVLVVSKSSLRHATCLFFSSFCFIQVPNGHEEDELADGEVMNYMCRDDEVMKENLSSYNCLILKLLSNNKNKIRIFFSKVRKEYFRKPNDTKMRATVLNFVTSISRYEPLFHAKEHVAFHNATRKSHSCSNGNSPKV